MKNKTSYIFNTLLILFILQLLTLPFVIKYTYAGRSASPDHTIVYTTGKLKWDNKTDINTNGVAKLSLFDICYKNAASGNGDKILAPGGQGDNTIRLKNNTDRNIDYTAVIYEIKNNEDLNVKVSMNGNNFVDTKKYNLPENIKNEKIIRAVKGSLDGNKIQDFDIDWIWDFEINDEIDTKLGNKNFNNKNDITVGFYISVVDDYTEIKPQTGDSNFLGTYVLLMIISSTLLILLFLDNKKKERRASENE